MYVCICKQITDNDIKRAVSRGACSMRALYHGLGVGMQCGKCCKQAHSILKEETNNQHLIRRPPTQNTTLGHSCGE